MAVSNDQERGTMIVLGGSGFVGRRVVAEAVGQGWQVEVLARSDDAARAAADAGAVAIRGDAGRPGEWRRALDGATVVVDLLQPPFPKRLGQRQLMKIAGERRTFTRDLLAALADVPAARRPVLISVSGIDDLAPDASGAVSADSVMRVDGYGLGPVGTAVRRMIEQADVKAAFVYLGTVYGAGKAFAGTIFPQLAAGRWKNFGAAADRLVLTHVDDAARGLVCIAGLPDARRVGRSFVHTDTSPVAMAPFFGLAASLMGVAAPGRIPRWLAALVVGRPLVETMLCSLPVRPSDLRFAGCELKYPSYREGLPPTLAELGYGAGASGRNTKAKTMA